LLIVYIHRLFDLRNTIASLVTTSNIYMSSPLRKNARLADPPVVWRGRDHGRSTLSVYYYSSSSASS